MVKMTMENGGVITLKMDRENAPNTVDNFLHLASTGFYNGLTFHRIIPGFMIQGGCPEGSGMGGPNYRIRGEFRENGVNNMKKHVRGVISMARAANMDSAGSQFFLMHADSPHLDGKYAAFGEVVDGLDVVDEIAAVQTGAMDRPIVPVRILAVEVIDEEVKEPQKM